MILIPPKINYLTKSLQILNFEEKINIFEKCLGVDESLFKGFIPKAELQFSSIDETLLIIKKYFQSKKYLEFMIEEDIDKGYNRNLEDFAKLCWLTDEFFNNGFKNPICVHYNPRIMANVIHPGGSRNQILNLFNKDDHVLCVYFNTGGVYFNWINKLEKINIRNLSNVNHIALVADHGSIIPHIHFEMNIIKSGVFKYQEIIRENLKTIKIKSNVNIPELSEFYSDSPTIILDFKNNFTNFDICRAVILLVLKKDYQSETLSVTVLK